MLKAGTYYVGDLCNAMSHEEWSVLIEATKTGKGYQDGEFEYKENRFAIYSTFYGGGCYHSNVGQDDIPVVFSVDSGTIGAISLDALQNLNEAKLQELKKLGVIFEFDTDFETEGTRHGCISFGDVEKGISIQTGDAGLEELTECRGCGKEWQRFDMDDGYLGPCCY